MTEKRLSRRIACTVGGTLLCREAAFRCRLENISPAGALATIREGTTTGIRAGDTCLLRLYHEIEGRYIILQARIAHHGLASTGLVFSGLDGETRASLETIVERERRKASNMGLSAAYSSPYGAAARCSP